MRRPYRTWAFLMESCDLGVQRSERFDGASPCWMHTKLSDTSRTRHSCSFAPAERARPSLRARGDAARRQIRKRHFWRLHSAAGSRNVGKTRLMQTPIGQKCLFCAAKPYVPHRTPWRGSWYPRDRARLSRDPAPTSRDRGRFGLARPKGIRPRAVMGTARLESR